MKEYEKKVGSILNVSTAVKMLSDVKQSWSFAKTAEAESKRHQTAWDKRSEERKIISKANKNI